MARLTAAGRRALPASEFALSKGHYPIDTANRARNALARISQFGSSGQKAKVRAAVHRKYPGIKQGGERAEERGESKQSSGEERRERKFGTLRMD